MNFSTGQQPIVDAAFLALAVLRAPTELWLKLDAVTQRNLVEALQATRVILPGYSNWLMFSAIIETALALMGVWWDRTRIDYAVRSVEGWYEGDGTYGDGPTFHWDYYNSFVIQPMLLHGTTASRSLQQRGINTSQPLSHVRNAMLRFRNDSSVRMARSRPSADHSVIDLVHFNFSPKLLFVSSFRTELNRSKCAVPSPL